MQQILQGTSVIQASAYLRHQFFRNIKGERRPWIRPDKKWLECFSPPRQAGQCSRVQGLRRTLRQPRPAGHLSASCSRNQSWTSIGDSVLGIAYVYNVIYILVKKKLRNPNLACLFEFRDRN